MTHLHVFIFNVFSDQAVLYVWFILASIYLKMIAFIPGNHKDTIQKLCFYNQKLEAPLFFYYFSNQSHSISFPLRAQDCFPSAVLLM